MNNMHKKISAILKPLSGFVCGHVTFQYNIATQYVEARKMFSRSFVSDW
jgi:hypothetical protein